MRFFVTCSKDATVYTDQKNQNTGLDQILEINKWTSSDVDRSSRIFVDFDFTEVSRSISNNVITEPTFSLNLKATKFREVPLEFKLDVYPISQSWEMGIGKRQDDPITTDGVSYRWRDKVNGNQWDTEGGDFITNVSSSFKFRKRIADLNIDVTDMVNKFLDHQIDNNGFVIKFPDKMETDDLNYGAANFFSDNSNTIYKPKIIVEYDDYTENSGSLSKVDSDDIFVTITNLKQQYKKNNSYKFKLFSRKMFPNLTFSKGSAYTKNNYLPIGSQYSVVDNVTNETIIPFSDISKISVDTNGSYFNLNFDGWEANRFYKILIKIDYGNGITEIIDKNFTFELIE